MEAAAEAAEKELAELAEQHADAVRLVAAWAARHRDGAGWKRLGRALVEHAYGR